MSTPIIMINCSEDDFYRDNILIKSLSSKCNESKPKFEVISLPFDKMDFSKKELQLFSFTYKNNEFVLTKEVKMIPISFPSEILFVKICCKHHFYNRELTIKDQQVNEIIKLHFDK